MARLKHSASASGIELIVVGLVLAVTGAGAVALLVLGLSGLYVGAYGTAVAELAGFLLGGGCFTLSYRRYLDRLEAWAPKEIEGAIASPVTASVPAPGDSNRPDAPAAASPADPAAPAADAAAQPVSTDVVVAVATLAYGLMIALGGLIWTRGEDLVFNLVAAGLLIICAAAVSWLGRRSRRAAAAAEA
jgi:hypothetical protein